MPVRVGVVWADAQDFPVNPKPFLQQQIGKEVQIRLKWGLEYRGFLVSTDNYMNFQVRCRARDVLTGSLPTRRRFKMASLTEHSARCLFGTCTCARS